MNPENNPPGFSGDSPQAYRFFREVFDALDIGLVVYGPDQTIYFVNQAALTLLQANHDQVIGRKTGRYAINVIREDGTPFTTDNWPIANVFRTGELIQQLVAGLAIPQSNHERIWLVVNATAETGPDGRVERVIATLSDFTRVKELLDALRQAQQRALEIAHERDQVRLLRRFIDRISRSFRTPLAVINNSAYLLARAPEPPRAREYLQRIYNKVALMGRVMDDIVRLVEIDETLALNLQSTDLNRVARRVRDAVAPNAGLKRLQLVAELHPDPVICRADELILEHAVLRIAENAVQYTQNEGMVTLRTRAMASEAVIEVEDTGIGIASTELPAIFEPLYRASAASEASDGGVGLGLTIARRIVGAHGGRIEVRSEPGRGSLFSVRLARDGGALPAGTGQGFRE